MPVLVPVGLDGTLLRVLIGGAERTGISLFSESWEDVLGRRLNNRLSGGEPIRAQFSAMTRSSTWSSISSIGST